LRVIDIATGWTPHCYSIPKPHDSSNFLYLQMFCICYF